MNTMRNDWKKSVVNVIKMDDKIIIECDGMRKEDIDELYHQIALKISPYQATMFRESYKGERQIGSILMSAKGLRNLADSMDVIYPKQQIRLPLWRFGESTYFQLIKGSGAIDLKGD